MVLQEPLIIHRNHHLKVYFALRAGGGRPPLAEAVLEGREGILSESSPHRAPTPLHQN